MTAYQVAEALAADPIVRFVLLAVSVDELDDVTAASGIAYRLEALGISADDIVIEDVVRELVPLMRRSCL